MDIGTLPCDWEEYINRSVELWANVAKSSRPWNKALEQSVKSLTFISLMGVSQVTIEMDRGLLCPKACFSMGSATDFHQLT